MKINDTIAELEDEIQRHTDAILALEEKVAPLRKKLTQLQIDNALALMRSNTKKRREGYPVEAEKDLATFMRERKLREKARAEKQKEAAKTQAKTRAKTRYKEQKASRPPKQRVYVADPIEAPANQIEFLERLETTGLIHEVLETISPRDKQILIMYYFEQKTTKEIAQYFSLTTGRIHDLHKRALRMLRHPHRADRLRESYPRNIFYTPAT